MRQIIQSFKTGDTILEEVPVPLLRKGSVLIQTSRTLVSLGTERMLVEFGRSNLLSKVRQQPDKVKQVLDKIKTEGLLPTLEAVFRKLGEPIPLGYCNVGRIIAVADDVHDFNVGDRVVSNGSHAEVVCIPRNLVAHIPENVSDDEAAFTVIGSIGLQGVRLLNTTYGETVVVIGMGLIGLMICQILLANGCNVIGIDIDADKLSIASSWGVKVFNSRESDPVRFVEENTSNIGADGVIITASARTDEIISQAARMSRKRGRIVLVGVIGLNLNRAEFYEKELSFQVSCSYGPGRYDENYEQRGNDYPVAFVRWTENRNFQAILQAISAGKLLVKELISEIVPLAEYQLIYGDIGKKKTIASLLKYDETRQHQPGDTIVLNAKLFKNGDPVIGIIGAGNFTKMTMLPALKKSDAKCKYIASASGLSGTTLAKKYGITHSTTDYSNILRDEEIRMVFITTRHDQHANFVIQALHAGKHVFVEKPLAINEEQLAAVIDAVTKSKKTVTVGFNRRFSPHTIKLKSILDSGAMNVIATMNAGSIPASHWTQDMNIGGGRIIGEACHFIDLISFLTGSSVTEVCMNAMEINPPENTDQATILLKYANGSSGVINYFSNGSKQYPKERIEVYSQGRVAVIDNFRQTTGFGFKGFSKLKTSLDKGHKKQFLELINTLKTGGKPLIPINELINTTQASFAAIQSLKQNCWVKLKDI